MTSILISAHRYSKAGRMLSTSGSEFPLLVTSVDFHTAITPHIMSHTYIMNYPASKGIEIYTSSPTFQYTTDKLAFHNCATALHDVLDLCKAATHIRSIFISGLLLVSTSVVSEKTHDLSPLQNFSRIEELNVSGAITSRDDLVSVFNDDAVISMFTTTTTSSTPFKFLALRKLSFSEFGQITDKALTCIGESCVNLEELSLMKNTKLTGPGFSSFKNVKRLKIVSLPSCYELVDDALKYLGEYCLDIQTLDLHECAKITSDGIKYLNNLQLLQRLNIPNLPLLTDEAIESIGNFNTELEGLHIYQSDQLTDNSLHFLSQLTKLRGLNIGSSTKITDVGVESLCVKAPNASTKLVYLDFNFLKELTNRAMFYVSECKSLGALHICWCENIDDDGIAFLTGLKNLKRISMAGLKKLTDATVYIHLSKMGVGGDQGGSLEYVDLSARSDLVNVDAINVLRMKQRVRVLT